MRSLNAFEEKIVVTVIELEFVCQTSTVFFLWLPFFPREYMRFALLRAL